MHLQRNTLLPTVNGTVSYFHNVLVIAHSQRELVLNSFGFKICTVSLQHASMKRMKKRNPESKHKSKKKKKKSQLFQVDIQNQGAGIAQWYSAGLAG
jgi:hypothetical protein